MVLAIAHVRHSSVGAGPGQAERVRAKVADSDGHKIASGLTRGYSEMFQEAHKSICAINRTGNNCKA